MGKDSSALMLSLLDLFDFPKYVVLRSKFSTNLVMFTISEWIPSYTSRYSSLNTFGVGPKSTSMTFSSSIPQLSLQMFTMLMPKL